MSLSDGELVMRIGNSTRVEESQIRAYKWASEKDDQEAFMYSNIINFKRSSNPRGHAHHCVMCGDRKAAIPSQNKDVCKTCDSGYWLVESVQVVVKFCKGCKNFTRLHDFRDKPEATKCIKCRQRGRQNYFAKKGRGDVISLLPPSNSKIGGGLETELDHLGGRPVQHTLPRGEYDYYQEEVTTAGGPRLTSSRQVALQKNRLSKNKGGMSSGTKSRNGGLRNERLYGGNQYIISDPSVDGVYSGLRPHDHERSNSFSSLLGGSYLPGDDGEGGGLLLGEDDDNGYLGNRSRSDTLLSISSMGLAGLGESLGVASGKQGKVAGRTRRGSEEWDLLASEQYSALLTQDVFDNELPPPSFSSDFPTNWALKGANGKGSYSATASSSGSNNMNNNNQINIKKEGYAQPPQEEEVYTRKRRLSETAVEQPIRSGSGVGKQVSLAAINAEHTDIGNVMGEHVVDQVETRRSRRDTVELLQSSYGGN